MERAARLNPCFSGCWSRTGGVWPDSMAVVVLILVLVDVGLGRALRCSGLEQTRVLILVLVDVGLGPVGCGRTPWR